MTHASPFPVQTKGAAKTESAPTRASACLATEASTVKSVIRKCQQMLFIWPFLATMFVLFVSAVIPQLCENENGGCEHFCHVARGNVQCSCADGYFLAPDDKSCHSNGEKSRGHMADPTKISKTFKPDMDSCRHLQVRWHRSGKYQKCFPIPQKECHRRHHR